MPAVVVAAIIGAAATGATAVGTSIYQSKQNKKSAARASDAEVRAAELQNEASQRAFTFGAEDLDYQRWLDHATGLARQPYLDQIAGMNTGRDYSPGTYAPAEPFVAPTREAATTDPGYQMTADAGNQAITDSAASRTTLLSDPSTLQDLQGYSTRAATPQYDKVAARARNAYAMREAMRGAAWDRTTDAGFRSASLGNQNVQARLGNFMSLGQLVGPGHYPGPTHPLPTLEAGLPSDRPGVRGAY